MGYPGQMKGGNSALRVLLNEARDEQCRMGRAVVVTDAGADRQGAVPAPEPSAPNIQTRSFSISVDGGAAQIHGDLRTLDAELVATVVRQLQGPVTVVRFVAGLKVLCSIYDLAEERDSSQSSAEVVAIAAARNRRARSTPMNTGRNFRESTL